MYLVTETHIPPLYLSAHSTVVLSGIVMYQEDLSETCPDQGLTVERNSESNKKVTGSDRQMEEGNDRQVRQVCVCTCACVSACDYDKIKKKMAVTA